ncbi:MAG: acyltransferase [Intestinimonas massiliensis]|nr:MULTISPECIES: acyltransferase [Intestinimonas]MCI5563282.1 acyltransferase [Intestinimonas massiliensis (ex Afouda et al. 2020)]MDY5338545.1 acyltransferase [Intestinimonas sp.]
MARSDQGRLAYADLLRVFACLAVIVVHVSGGWLESLPAGTADWNLLNAWDCLAHWCVPVFVMCSGMFLLDPKKSLAWPHLLFRYLLRVAVALVFWGVVYALMNTALFRGLTLRGVLDALYAVVLGSVPTHLWFLYMVAGLYLLTPLLRAFVRGARRSDFHWFFLVVFLFVYVLPLFLRLRGSQTVELYANKLYLNFTLAYPPLAYVGYFVAGYYLKEYTLGRVAEGLIYVLGVAGAAATVWGSAALNAGNGPGEFNGLTMSYLTPNVCAMSVAVFVLFRYVLGLSDERSPGPGQPCRRLHLRRLSGPRGLPHPAALLRPVQSPHHSGAGGASADSGHRGAQLRRILAPPQDPGGGPLHHLTQRRFSPWIPCWSAPRPGGRDVWPGPTCCGS